MSIKNNGDKNSQKVNYILFNYFEPKKHLIDFFNVIISYSFTDITRSKLCKKRKVPEEIGKYQHFIVIIYNKYVYIYQIEYSFFSFVI